VVWASFRRSLELVGQVLWMVSMRMLPVMAMRVLPIPRMVMVAMSQRGAPIWVRR
jgi:hypothetical protein